MALPLHEPKKQAVDPIEQEKLDMLKIVRDIPLRVGIHSGKGGVGKTFVATQLALLLSQAGKKVGLIDADVDCPNIPTAFNIQEEMRMTDRNKLLPIVYKDIKMVSTGFMQDEHEPMIIRGPIKHRLLTDFIEKTVWGELDVLIFDFPPGTSDVPLSAMQVANLTGVILVTTPQKSSVQDVRRAKNMADKLNTPIYGLIENMSGEVFGSVGEELAQELKIPFLESIPLSKETREKAEQGEIAIAKDILNFMENQ